jgi:PfaD family protein
VRTATGETLAEVLSVDTLPNPAPRGGPLLAVLPPVYPEWLGSRGFVRDFGSRFPYVVGEMARGIASAEMVTNAAKAGMVAFFGSAGLPGDQTQTALAKIRAQLGPAARNWGANLIHSPQDPAAEMDFASLALQHRLGAVSASAFMRLSPAVVWLSSSGLRRHSDGSVDRPTKIFAKVSRVEVAEQFLSPAPQALLRDLVDSRKITAEEAELAAGLPVAEQITAEADSGGHTDNRPLTVLLPMITSLTDELCRKHGYSTRPRIGAAGGLGTPAAVAAAFGAGADYVVTGSVNQCALESGLSTDARSLLAEARATDTAMAPAGRASTSRVRGLRCAQPASPCW